MGNFVLPFAYDSTANPYFFGDTREESIRLDATDYLRDIARAEKWFKRFGEDGPTPEERLLVAIFGL